MFYDSSYVSDMYEFSRAAHQAAKENLEEQRDRQEQFYQVQNVHPEGPGHHLLPQPAAGSQSKISHLLENIQ
jgi:hypothetical protein